MIGTSTFVIFVLGAMSAILVLMFVLMLMFLYRDVRIVQGVFHGLFPYTRGGVAICGVVLLMIPAYHWTIFVDWHISTVELANALLQFGSQNELLLFESNIARMVVIIVKLIIEDCLFLGGLLALHELNSMALPWVQLRPRRSCRVVGVEFDPDALCPITLDVMQTPVRTKCEHIFELDALSKWVLEGNSLCPLCRRQLVS
jgi:hypothetical protein